MRVVYVENQIDVMENNKSETILFLGPGRRNEYKELVELTIE